MIVSSMEQTSTPRTRAAWYLCIMLVAMVISRWAYWSCYSCYSSYSSYSDFPQVTELLIAHGANVNAMDLWQFTPLHEAASKSRTEVLSTDLEIRKFAFYLHFPLTL